MRLKAFAGVVVGVFFAGIAAGLPFNAKRELTTDYVFVTEIVADVAVYVDENGTPYLTSTIERVAMLPTSVVEPTPVNSASVVPSSAPYEPTPIVSLASTAPEATASPMQSSGLSQLESPSAPAPTPPPSPAPEPPAAPAPAPEPAPSVQAVPEPKASANAVDRFPLGITYDTYKGSAGNVECKTESEMKADFETMKTFGIVRIYGDDCGVIAIAVQQAKKNGQKIMAGIYSPNQAVDTVVKALSNAVNQFNGGDWSIISVVSVENERVNAHVLTASSAVDTLNQARQALAKVGYHGPIGPVETVPALVDNPALCDQADMALVNIHAFFDPNTKAEDSGTFVKSEVERVKKACPNKRVVVTESGWPSQGTSHNKAVVSKDAQRAAINSIKASFDHDLFLFNAFDSPWKTDDASTFNSEKWWGIL
ncbi:glycoside hydrolase [Byssothecium circinans]|uniref:Glycoside hydrolase n=1 Tax=Byssothecium circinans TaxID=147558 RepID=A0A6A5TVY6_9PLEO|nr:glycoside hydrolase [Byssothecium circinans]